MTYRLYRSTNDWRNYWGSYRIFTLLTTLERNRRSRTKLGVFATGPAIPNTFANLLSEMIGTFVLVFGILAIGANKFADGLNPFIVGFLIVSIGLSLGGTTGYAINPARDLGPRIAHFFLPIAGKGGSNWKYAWIPVVGPILGASLAGLFHQVVFEGKQNAALIYVIIATVIVLAISYMTSKKVEAIQIVEK